MTQFERDEQSDAAKLVEVSDAVTPDAASPRGVARAGEPLTQSPDLDAADDEA